MVRWHSSVSIWDIVRMDFVYSEWVVLTHVNVEKALEVLRRVRHGVPPIREEDASISVVDVRVLKLLPRGGVLLDTLGSNCLPGSKGISSSLDSVGGSNKLVASFVSAQIEIWCIKLAYIRV